MEFNADGSLKLGGSIGKKLEDDREKMSTSRCVKIAKHVTRSTSPKLCTLSITESASLESGFVERVFSYFAKRANSTVKLNKIAPKEFQLTIGNEFSRCKDCQMFVSSTRDYLEGNVIEKKGNCTFKGGNFWY
jgi:hypothetical protein